MKIADDTLLLNTNKTKMLMNVFKMKTLTHPPSKSMEPL